MAVRNFLWHDGYGSLEYDDEGAVGIYYGAESAATHKRVSRAIARLIQKLEWCYRCDLELPVPIYDRKCEKLVMKAMHDGQMNLADTPWSMIRDRIRDQRCPSCGALMTPEMVKLELHMGDDMPKGFEKGF
jgi:hypothetical protein